MRNDQGQTIDLLSPTFFIHNQIRKDEFGKAIPENEVNIKAYYHPGLAIDNINGNNGKLCEGDTVGLGYQSSLIFRARGKTAWQVTSDYNNSSDLDFSIRQNGGVPFFSTGNTTERILLKRVKEGQLGKGVEIQNHHYGNSEIQGLLNVHGELTLYNPKPANVNQGNRFQLGADDNGIYIKQSYRGSGKGTSMRFYLAGELQPSLTLSADDASGKNYRMKINGSALASGYWVDSDRRFKTNDHEIKEDVEGLMLLKPKRYNYVSHSKRHFESGLNYGFFAQELQKVYPALVHEDKSGFLAVNYTGLIPLLTKAYQNDHQQIQAQEGRLQQLEKENELLKKELEEIKQLLQNQSEKLISGY